jgi:hypothetical protein
VPPKTPWSCARRSEANPRPEKFVFEYAGWATQAPRCALRVQACKFFFSQTTAEVARMVSVVVSIRMRKMFAEVRKMFANARDAEQDVRERQASRNF